MTHCLRTSSNIFLLCIRQIFIYVHIISYCNLTQNVFWFFQQILFKALTSHYCFCIACTALISFVYLFGPLQTLLLYDMRMLELEHVELHLILSDRSFQKFRSGAAPWSCSCCTGPFRAPVSRKHGGSRHKDRILTFDAFPNVSLASSFLQNESLPFSLQTYVDHQKRINLTLKFAAQIHLQHG